MIIPGLTPQTCTLVEHAGKLNDQWCIYEVHKHNPETGQAQLIYINACHIRYVYTLAEIRRNSQWEKTIKPSDYIYVKIIHTGPRDLCNKEASRLVRELNPAFNLRGFDTSGANRPIICSNGNTYATQVEAAQALNINQGALSRHLSDKGVKHIKGLTFRYKELP